jgi:hypothetical protein
MRASLVAILVCALAAPAAAKPHRFQPAGLYAGLFRLHHAWTYAVDYTDGARASHHTVRCVVAKVMANRDAIVSRVDCTHADWQDSDYEPVYAFGDSPPVPDGIWYADAGGLRELAAPFPRSVPANPDRPYVIEAAPVEISRPGDDPEVPRLRRTRDGWCVDGPSLEDDGRTRYMPSTCYGARGLPERDIVTEHPDAHLVSRLAP